MLSRNKVAISVLLIGFGSFLYSNLIAFFFKQSVSYFRNLNFLLSMFRQVHLMVMGISLIIAYLTFKFERSSSRYLLFSFIYFGIAIALLLMLLNTRWLDFLLPPMSAK